MVCQVVSCEISLFYNCITIVHKFGKLYKDSGKIKGIDNLIDLNIVW